MVDKQLKMDLEHMVFKFSLDNILKGLAELCDERGKKMKGTPMQKKYEAQAKSLRNVKIEDI